MLIQFQKEVISYQIIFLEGGGGTYKLAMKPPPHVPLPIIAIIKLEPS